MNCPDWAPKSLVKLHKLRLESNRAGNRTKSFNPDEYIEKLKLDEKFSNYDEAAFKSFKESIYRNQLFLPDMEGDLLLERLLTDQRMRDAWLSLSRRKKQMMMITASG